MVSYYTLKSFDHAVATGDLVKIVKLWPAIKQSIQHKPDYAKAINQE